LYSAKAPRPARSLSNVEKSAADWNALSPAPVNTSTRMAASAANSASACSTVGYIPSETALRRSGLSKTSRATGPALSALSFRS